MVAFTDAWDDDVDEAAEESLDPLEMIPELFVDALDVLLTDGIADAPDVALGI